jgi:flagellar basal body-associated protein FliL
MKNVPSISSIIKVMLVIVVSAFSLGIALYFFWEFLNVINYTKIFRFILLFSLIVLTMQHGLKIAQDYASEGIKSVKLSADFKTNLVKGLIIDQSSQTRLSQFEIDSIASLAKKEIDREIKGQLEPILTKMFITAIAMFSFVLFVFFFPIMGLSVVDRLLRLIF